MPNFYSSISNPLNLFFSLIILLSFQSRAFAAENWSSESELGIVVNQGNAESQSVSVKNFTQYKLTTQDTFSFKGEYFQSEGLDDNDVKILTSENSMLELKYEKLISERFGAFITTSWAKDNFRGFEQRFEVGPGLSYYFVKSDLANLLTEQGYLYRQDTPYVPGPGSGISDSISFYRSYFEGNKKFSPTLSGKLWVETKLNIEDTEDVEVRIEPSLSVMLYGNFSLGLAYRYSFDNVPPAAGLLRVDTMYMTTLKAKF